MQRLSICLGLLTICGASDYNVIQACRNFTYSLELRKVFILHQPDQVIIQVLFPVSLIACIGMTAMYIRFKAIRQQPGDILLALSISSLFLLTSYFATVMYNYEYPIKDTIPANFDAFCQVTGYFYALSFCCNLIYNVVFCAYFIIQIKHTLKDYRRKWLVHLISLCVLAAVGVIFYLTDSIGVSFFGICGFKISAASIFLQSGLIAIYLVIAIASLLYFRKYVPRSSVSQEHWRLFTQYYFRYIIVISVDTLVRCTSDLISAINCMSKDPHANLQTFITVSNFFNIITPAIVFVVVLLHPEVKASLKKLTLRACGKKSEQEHEDNEEEDETDRVIEMELLYRIKEEKKTALVYTLLMAIFVEDSQIRGCDSLRDLHDWNFQDKLLLNLNEDMMAEYQNVRIPSLKVLNVQITSYAPKVFKTLMRLDGISNMQEHVKPYSNTQQVKRLIQSDGGKSGQFFFFTFDNKVILKTLLKKQLAVIMSRLKEYVHHCIHNPYSLITKICGIYTITDLETRQQYTIYSMRNLAGCDRHYVDRIYDLKGSKFDRQVFQDYSKIDVGHINKTMKDQDFAQLQKKIIGEPGTIQQIKSILIEDTMFFRSQKLIDYSLIIIRLDIDGLLEDKNMSRDSYMRTIANPYSIIFNQQNDCAYVIGIIDYLETWGANKKGEKFLKSIFFKTKSEHISAQSPEIYSQRFVKELVNKIF